MNINDKEVQDCIRHHRESFDRCMNKIDMPCHGKLSDEPKTEIEQIHEELLNLRTALRALDTIKEPRKSMEPIYESDTV